MSSTPPSGRSGISAPGGLNNFQFTFESIPERTSLHSSLLEPDMDPDDEDSESLTESIENFPSLFGRTYHAYQAGSYAFPNDALERERLDLQSLVLTELFSGRLHYAPIEAEHSRLKMLDVATGTGAWAMEMGDLYPSATIIGTDLSPIQPRSVPPNVHFYVEDSAEPWTWPDPFDYIHTRVTLGSFANFKEDVAQQAFDNLRPGGWFESQDFNCTGHCDDGTLDPNGPLMTWFDDMNRASDMIDRPISVADKLKGWYEEVGFVDVQQRVYKMPLNGWAKDPTYKHIGKLWELNFLTGLSGLSLALFSKVLGRTPEEIQVSLVDVRREISDQRIHAYSNIYVVWGRKPYPSETVASDSAPDEEMANDS